MRTEVEVKFLATKLLKKSTTVSYLLVYKVHSNEAQIYHISLQRYEQYSGQQISCRFVKAKWSYLRTEVINRCR